MSLIQVKLKLTIKRAETVNAFLNVNSSNPSDYHYFQGIIHGIDVALRLIDESLKEEDDTD